LDFPAAARGVWISSVADTAVGGRRSAGHGGGVRDGVSLEGEAGTGDGLIVQRSRASGGQTVHLGPGERRLWTFDVRAAPARYALSVTYANGKEGPNEVISVTVDGTAVRSFQNRDSGDSIEGWNLFVTDPAGVSTLGPGSHTIALEVSGGDGCVEVDVVTVSPDAGASSAS
jgi:hypothetical protein